MKKYINKYLSLLLCLALLLGMGGCAKDGSEESVSSSAVLGANEELVPQYCRPDTENYAGDCEKLATCTDPDEAIALYDELMQQCREMSTMYTIASIVSDYDLTDEYWSEEVLWCYSSLLEMGDELGIACSELLNGSCAEEFRAYIGESAAEVLAEYEEMSEELQELYERESELINDYYVELDASYELTVEYEGQDWSVNRLYYTEDGNALYEGDYEGFKETYYMLQEKIGEVLGPIYMELVEIRNEIALLSGYDSYTDYAYEVNYGRDYSAEDAEVFCEAVKEIGIRYYEEVYYDSYSYYYEFGSMEEAELLEAMGQYAEEIAPVVAEKWQYMMDNHLYCLPAYGTNDSCNTGGYTATLDSVGSAFIYNYLWVDGESDYDFRSMTHEFGHFIDACLNPIPNLLTSVSNYDLFEIHSNGLEVLYTAFYDDIFGEDADAARHGTVEDQLYMVVDGCIYDEFQRRVYAKEEITLEEVNSIYKEVCLEFGFDVGDDPGYGWMYIAHNYDSPLYYLSYAISSLGALQIWQLSGEDFDAAADMWLAVVEKNAYDKGTVEVMTECGMISFTDVTAVKNICDTALDYLTSFH